MSEAELRKIAAADLGETNVEAIVNHRGELTKAKIEFEVLWSGVTVNTLGNRGRRYANSLLSMRTWKLTRS
jgi:hypothetical protein